MIGDVEKMVAIGIVWGATNALMRRGALLWDQALKSSSNATRSSNKLLSSLRRWLKVLSIWQYTVPFLVNLTASATFFAILSDAPISLAVPVTNATTFAATAVFGMLLGEETRVGYALFGFYRCDCNFPHSEMHDMNVQRLLRNIVLELSSITFWWHLPIEPFSVFAVIIYHVVLLDFIKLSQLRSTELCISWGSPPVCWGLSGTLTNAGYSIPVTSSWPKVAKACREWCVGPIGFHAASLSCPIICIPQAGIYPHTLLLQKFQESPGTSLMRASKLPNKKSLFDFAPEPATTESFFLVPCVDIIEFESVWSHQLDNGMKHNAEEGMNYE
ncbi:Transmembrane protein 234-like protein, partial [Cucurbita argyrosperma subsp. sororia]